MAIKKKLPIGIQNLREMREEGYYYVDKTEFAHRLIKEGKYYFLSRPRRFGKSLFLDTLKEIFEGNEGLFAGLYIHDKWEWNKKHPVIRVSFSDGVLKSRQELDVRIGDILEQNAKLFGVRLEAPDIAGKLRELIEDVRRLRGAGVVVLIDEYDKPILDNIEDDKVAAEMREGLKNLYSVLKGADPHLKFVMLTGVSKFSKVSLFSGLNNLKDITLDGMYSAVCGYTESDLDTVFGGELEGKDRGKVREWYNGYNWLGEAVYNPFDILLFLDSGQFKPYWFETGTPTFLIKLLRERETWLPGLDQSYASEKLLSTFDVGNIPTEALMFQTGYLTIDKEEKFSGESKITLKFPNREVYQSLFDTLLMDLTQQTSRVVESRYKLWGLLQKNDIAGMGKLLTAFFAGIPYQWHARNNIAEYEGYYASVFYAYFASLGLDIAVEESSCAGRLDMAVRFNGHVYIFEFKVVDLEAEGRALEQIKAGGYAEKYRVSGQPIHQIGVEFSREKRQVVGFEEETLGDKEV